MATATSREQNTREHLPPSPPPSPHSTRRRHKKRHDSFAKLANTPIPSPPSSPSHRPIANDDDDSLLGRVSTLIAHSTIMILTLTDCSHTRTFRLVHSLSQLRQSPRPSSANVRSLKHIFPHIPLPIKLAQSRTVPRSWRLELGSERNDDTRQAR
jgi:hypothetical protein